ncbi:type II toxin-antitoxin system VapC family toxin [Kumtagia ephedrae]|jgi:predicted nucleic acid-binding protein|uniref:VapC toxin family PIN domain ribonuclease n=1 Tax=Kumtagia ephedrae TaxID=2116701 RepID=A0A2P7RHW7_9HYPH|nr:type II toxin-antitoxin system VapC family toxin [Mesorhizobium ephedrae]PSJ49836.1 VapC toxin family PIN domain ribonuclease [Mesorhizobium ephedrae]
MILVDSSIWVDHLRRALPELEALLADERVLTHPFIIGELAMGSLKNRRMIIRDLSNLPKARMAGDDEVLALVERFAIHSRGIGYVDAHLLASTRLTLEATLWTRDSRCRTVAEELGIAFSPPSARLQ